MSRYPASVPHPGPVNDLKPFIQSCVSALQKTRKLHFTELGWFVQQADSIARFGDGHAAAIAFAATYLTIEGNPQCPA